MATPFFVDSFVDSAGVDLTAHTPTALGGSGPASTGGAWLKNPNSGSSAIVVSPSGDARPAVGASLPLYYASVAPTSTEYTVECDWKFMSTDSCYIFLLSHLDSTANTYYCVYGSTESNTITIRKMFNGGYDDEISTTVGFTPGSTYHIALTTALSGSSLVLNVSVQQVSNPAAASQNGMYLVGGAYQSSPGVALTWTDNSPLPAGYAGLGFYEGATDTTGLHAANFSASNPGGAAPATTYTVALSSSSTVTGTPVTVTYSASGSLASAVTITPTLSGVTGTFSPATATLAAGVNSSAALTFTPSTVGTASIGGTNSGSLTNPSPASCTVHAAPVPITDTRVYFSPYNWLSDGTGTPQSNNVLPGSTKAISNNVGAYLRLKVVSTTSNGSVTLNLDTTQFLTGGSAANNPTLAVSVDGGNYVAVAPAYQSSGLYPCVVASGLAAGTHTIKVVFDAVGWGMDHWTAPAQCLLVVKSVQTDDGSTLAAPTLQPKNAVLYGDSISVGWNILAGGDYGSLPAGPHAALCWNLQLADYLGYELGVIGCPSQGYEQAGIAGSNVPNLPSSYTLYWAGQSRLIGGVLLPSPDLVLDDHGTNGTVNASDVQTMIGNYRAIAPHALIAELTTFAYLATAAKKVGYAAYQAAHPSDTNLAFDDTIASLNNSGTSNDGIHPNLVGAAQYLAALEAGWVAAVATPTFSPAAGSYSTAQTVTIATTTAGATIRYTTDGSTPTESHGTVYSGAVSVVATETLKAIAYKAPQTDSAVASATYTISTAVYPPVNTVLAGTVYGPTGTEYTGTAPTPDQVAAAVWAYGDRTVTA